MNGCYNVMVKAHAFAAGYQKSISLAGVGSHATVG